MNKRVLLGASHSVIEPLGLLHLSSIAKQEGYQPKVVLSQRGDFKVLDETINNFRPDFLGFTLYTGNHILAFEYFDRLKQKAPGLKIILGGPHATYFPQESIRHADYVVLSEGFSSFRKILRNEVAPGIIHFSEKERFPIADREQFYSDHPKHGGSPIKSIITQTGCPYSCTYCYNSSTLEDISDALTPEQTEEMKKALYPFRRLFPRTMRSVDDVVREAAEIKVISPSTELIYFQDDVFVGVDVDWIREFAEKFPPLGMAFHAQIRVEYADPRNPKNREKIEMIREAGCSGLTLAIESADPVIRKEVLNRNMKEELIFEVFEFLNSLGFMVRTEQMLGLPTGATTKKTRINLEADLETLELNVRLREATNLPTMAWASIFAPYRGTRIGSYCLRHGFYAGRNNDVPETFFERSVLNFPKHWVGPGLSPANKDFWLSEEEREQYKNNMQRLRDLFSVFALIPKGHKLAEKFLDQQDQSYAAFSQTTRRHLYDSVLYDLE